ncbi:hypothetical protein [Kitasatospora griseola]|uniref:hypothetical protein n=1 Tax=Kitasatospora griseola TaxID=2064 RepID=UPI0036551A61
MGVEIDQGALFRDTETALVRVTAQDAAMLPTEAEAGRSSAAGGVLKTLEHAHWTEG